MKKILMLFLVFSVSASSGYAQILKRTVSNATKQVKKVVIYSEGKDTSFAPSGWMGDAGAIKVDAACTTKPKSGKFCMKWTYDAAKSTKEGWAGVYWQYPANNWGSKKGLDLAGHKKLSFWVRGDTGKEVIGITAGGISGDKGDSFKKELKGVKLSSEWKQYTIDLSGKDLSNVVGGFCWTADSKENNKAITFYFDDIIYE